MAASLEPTPHSVVARHSTRPRVRDGLGDACVYEVMETRGSGAVKQL